VDRIARASARRHGSRAALAKLSEERHRLVLAVAEARRAEITAEAEKLGRRNPQHPQRSQRMLDKLAALMEVEVFPISILFGRTVTPVDRRNLDPDALPMDFSSSSRRRPSRCGGALLEPACRSQAPGRSGGGPRAAQRLLGEEAA
jgi:chorismate mutase